MFKNVLRQKVAEGTEQQSQKIKRYTQVRAQATRTKRPKQQIILIDLRCL